MSEINLEKEIQEASDRIEQRESEILHELSKLEGKTTFYTRWVLILVFIGIVIVIISTFYTISAILKMIRLD